MSDKRNLRLIVCGGRHYEDRAFLFSILDKIHTLRGIAEIIEGDAAGADWLAGEWAKVRGVKLMVVPANWTLYRKRAGPMRNREMLKLKPDGVVSFPGGSGTADMCRAAEEAGVVVWKPADGG